MMRSMLASVKTATSICFRLPNNIDHRLNSSAGLITISANAPAGDAKFARGGAGFDQFVNLPDHRSCTNSVSCRSTSPGNRAPSAIRKRSISRDALSSAIPRPKRKPSRARRREGGPSSVRGDNFLDLGKTARDVRRTISSNTRSLVVEIEIDVPLVTPARAATSSSRVAA